MKLIIMACSSTKRREPGPITALERYDGPMWRTLRAQLARSPIMSAAYAGGELRIWVLSAKYGFIDATTQVPDYDRKMTAPILAKMARDPSYDFQRIPHMVSDAEAALFAGGELYRSAMWKASGANLWNIMKIAETDGAGIGLQRAQLSAWLGAQYPSERLAL